MQIQPQIIPDSNHQPRILILGSLRPLHCTQAVPVAIQPGSSAKAIVTIGSVYHEHTTPGVLLVCMAHF